MHKIIIISFIFLIITLVAGHYLFYTNNGSSYLANFLIKKYLAAKNITIGEISGTLAENLTFKKIKIENITKLPPASIITIQQLDFKLSLSKLIGLKSLSIVIFNGKLQLPFSDVILFYGQYKNAKLDLHVYAQEVSAQELLDLFFQRPVLRTVSGVIKNLNMHLIGSLFSFALEGKFYIGEISNSSFTMLDCPGSMLIYCNNIMHNLRLNGEVTLNKAEVFGQKTAKLFLRRSKIIFEEKSLIPQLHIRATANVEETKINLLLRGTHKEPQLELSAYPPLPEETILVMLATGRSFGLSKTALDEGKISADLVRDFVDYFMFSGAGSKIAQYLGWNNVSLNYDQKTQDIKVKTDLINFIELNYQRQFTNDQQGGADKQSIGTKIKVTDNVSLGVEKEIGIQPADENVGKKDMEDKVFIDYNKRF